MARVHLKSGNYELSFRSFPVLEFLGDLSGFYHGHRDYTVCGSVQLSGPNVDVKVGNFFSPVYLRHPSGRTTNLIGRLSKKLTEEERGDKEIIVHAPSGKTYDAICELVSELHNESHLSTGQLVKHH